MSLRECAICYWSLVRGRGRKRGAGCLTSPACDPHIPPETQWELRPAGGVAVKASPCRDARSCWCCRLAGWSGGVGGLRGRRGPGAQRPRRSGERGRPGRGPGRIRGSGAWTVAASVRQRAARPVCAMALPVTACRAKRSSAGPAPGSSRSVASPTPTRPPAPACASPAASTAARSPPAAIGCRSPRATLTARAGRMARFMIRRPVALRSTVPWPDHGVCA